MSTEIQDVSRAVVSWLEYKSLTGMAGLFTEASMAVPIAEFLSRRHGKEIESEVAHPIFDKGRLGRPKQLDFVRKARSESKWLSAYECKFENASLYAIINDLCRLVCLSQVDGIGSPDRFFIFARKTGVSSDLLKGAINVGGGRQGAFDKILRQNGDDRFEKNAFRIEDLHEKQRVVFRSFAKRHKVKLPSKIVTTLSGFSKADDYCCAVWRVTSEQGSKLLSHKEISK